MAGTFTVIESWLNQEVGSTFRGRIFAIYVIFSSGAAGLAPLSLTILDPFGDRLFLVIAMAFALAPLGMMVRLPRVPVIEGRAPLRLDELFAISPGGMIACFGHGLVNSALYQVTPVYFERLGFDPALLSVFLSAAIFAGVLMQWPIGALGDRFARHHLLLALALLAATAALPLAIVKAPPYYAVLAAGIVLAAFAQPFYSLGVAIANDRLTGLDFVGAAGSLLLVWAAGAAVGPVLSAALIDAVGPFGLFVYLSAVSLILAGVTLHRMLVRPLPSPSPAPPTVPTRG
jgi:MFS family permease